MNDPPMDDALVFRCECALSAVASLATGEAERVNTAAHRAETQVESWRDGESDWVRAQTCTYDTGALAHLAARADLIRSQLMMELKHEGMISSRTVEMTTELAARALPFVRARFARQDAPTELATVAWQFVLEDLEQMAGTETVVTRPIRPSRTQKSPRWGGRLGPLMENAGDDDMSRN